MLIFLLIFVAFVGVGQVVLQVAASSKCKKCYGIEPAEWPVLFAKVCLCESDFVFVVHYLPHCDVEHGTRIHEMDAMVR